VAIKKQNDAKLAILGMIKKQNDAKLAILAYLKRAQHDQPERLKKHRNVKSRVGALSPNYI
jgi:hypothetical protein